MENSEISKLHKDISTLKKIKEETALKLQRTENQLN